MRHNLSRKPHTDTFHTLCKEQWELHRKVHRLVVSSIVGFYPFRSFRVKNHLQSERCKSRFDISCCRCRVSCVDVSPVSLSVYQEFFLTNLHHGICDGSIPMRVIFHGISHDVCYLVVSSIFQLAHRMHDTALNRLKTIINRWNGTVQNYIRGVIKKPILIKPRYFF